MRLIKVDQGWSRWGLEEYGGPCPFLLSCLVVFLFSFFLFSVCCLAVDQGRGMEVLPIPAKLSVSVTRPAGWVPHQGGCMAQLGCMEESSALPAQFKEHKYKYKDKDKHKDKYKDKYKNNRQTYDVICFWKGDDNRSLIMKIVQNMQICRICRICRLCGIRRICR